MKAKRLHQSRPILALVLALGAVVMLYPFFYMILSSFKGNAEIARTPPTFLPEAFTLSNYQKGLRRKHRTR